MAGIGMTLMMLVSILSWLGRIGLGIVFLSGLYLLVFKSVGLGLMVVGGAVVGVFLLNGLTLLLGALGMHLVERGVDGARDAG